jgi:DNA-binding transcriptional LysR family regulator
VSNPHGAALLSHGWVAFDEIKQAIREIEFLANPNVGEVRIGCPESIAAAILPPVMERLSRRYPGVVPIIGEVATSTLGFTELRARKFDLLVAHLSAPFVQGQPLDDLNVQVLFDDELVVAASADSPWGRRRKIDLTDLADAPWILAEPNSWNRAIIEEAFGARGLRMPKISSMTFSVHVRANLVATGAFITTFPRSVMALYARRFSLKTLPVDIPARPWPVAVLTLRKRTSSPVVELFIDHLRTYSKALI